MSVSTACRVLKVARSGYYAWHRRHVMPPAGRRLAEQELMAEIRRVHALFPAYGSPRVHRELVAGGFSAGRHRVARLMQLGAIKARRGRPKSRPRSAPPIRRPEVKDLVRRRFSAPAADRLWCTDVTQIATGEGWLYAAVIIDVYSRRIVSWAVSDNPAQDMSLRALTTAIKQRRPQPGAIVHSDRGSHYASMNWFGILAAAGLRPSIGERKSALDNAMIESWFSSFKQEAIYPYPRPTTRREATMRLFEHIQFHNLRRRHSALHYLSPNDYEMLNAPAP
jgi:putative transposase